MTFKEFFAKMGEALKASGKSIWNALLNAKLSSIIKLGVFVGGSITTIVLLIKMLKDRRKAYKNKENKTTVDEALERNFTDMRNQDELHPLMNRVKKNLRKDIKPRLKKSAIRRRKARKQYAKDLEKVLRNNAFEVPPRKRQSKDDKYNWDRELLSRKRPFDIEPEDYDEETEAKIRDLLDEYDWFVNANGWRQLDIEEACMDPDFGTLRRVWDSVV